LFWLGILAAHGTGAAAWWWLLPGGFPVGHPRFWVNQVLPWVVLVLVVGIRFFWWERAAVRQRVFAGFAVFWIGVAVAARVVFPVSAAVWFVAPLVLGLGMLAAVLVARPRPDWWAAVVAAPALVLGARMPLAERGAAPDTWPVSDEVVFPETLQAPTDARAIVIAPEMKLDPGDAVVTVTSGRMMLNVQPVLAFVARSPDRCWTLFAPKALRDGPARRLVHLEQTGDRIVLGHRDDTVSMTEFSTHNGALEIDSWTHLPAPVYSHLNTSTEVTITGHKKLAVSFSPCGDARVEFKPFSIQGDSPGRAAYLDADGSFKVVQARTGEKGPFSTLAAGKLARSEPLVMTLFDQGQAVFEITLTDWAAQCGVQLSPTAGWGLPVNAIEFSLDGDSDRSAGGMWITLAATSVGRGWDTVGHAAGTYRNRVKVRVLR
jgi:hypothetical protein